MPELMQRSALADAFGPPEFPPIWADSWGDDAYGLFATIHVGKAAQQFRWIPPGSFQMGSPVTEIGRLGREGPQHKVTLTLGFWMADTACTQEFWAAVMETESRSKFEGPTLPVESVDWNESDAFAKRLDAHLKAGLRSFPQLIRSAEYEVSLPTEAQWEYACRAESTTAFNVGVTLTSDQANFDATIRYLPNDGKGISREKTVPVKTFAPNAWGLYEMHGNVWEWCVDGYRTYGNDDEVDPGDPFSEVLRQGEADDNTRAIRGGSWGSDPRNVRSAIRDRGHRGLRYQVLGLRLVLRSRGPTSAQ
jgi:formylglycine-generating enzyme